MNYFAVTTNPKKGAILAPDPAVSPPLAAGRGPRRIRSWPACPQAPTGGGPPPRRKDAPAMSDRQVPQTEATPDHRPDRAIESAAEDRLGRNEFVPRLARALVTPAGRASGVVVGLSGPWGSGKSSILNLLAEECGAAAKRENRPAPVVVRFDPWLVSGRDDLITQFFAELLATIKAVGTDSGLNGEALEKFTKIVASYVKDLGPVVELVLPGFGKPVAAGAKVLERLTTRDGSLAKQKRDLTEMLGGVKVPIIVLVDELDRVEDAEVRAVAQLVRAVADFPGISYLLAYDRARVVEALGGGDKERGARYLEKIVQLEIRIPNSLPSEIRGLLDDALHQIARQSALPSTWSEERRFTSLREILVPGVLSTPRDLRRVTGMAAVLAGMVGREVDWVDLLAYSALLAKTPRVVDAMQHRPADFTIDYLGTDWVRWAGGRERSPEERLKDFDLAADSSEAKLLAFLFPCFAAEEPADEQPPERMLRTLDGVNTVLRLGLLPGAIPRDDFAAFLLLNADEKQRELQHRTENGTFELFVQGLLHAYPAFDDPNPVGTIMLFSRRPSPEILNSRFGIHELDAQARGFRRFVHRAIRFKSSLAPAVVTAVEDLLNDRQFELPARFLCAESEDHGLDDAGVLLKRFGRVLESQPRTRVEDIHRLRDKFGTAIRSALSDGSLLKTLHTLFPIDFGIRIRAWDEACRSALTEAIEGDEAVFLAFVQIWTNAPDPIPESVSKILDIDVLHRRLAEIKEVGGGIFDDPSVRVALEKAHQAVNRYERSVLPQDLGGDG